MQSTGLWAPAQKEVTIKSNANVPVTVTVALADDLTGREKHEVALNRPPRVTKTYSLDASGTGEVQGALRWPDLYQGQ
ncbi:inner membrane lipoprotein [Escherichia coli]|nr:inner membrane lipoprotein [Escherichia coli]